LETRGTLLAFWRNVFATAVILPFARRPRWNPRLVPMTLCFTAMTVTFLQSMTRTTAANTIWLQSTAPLWVFLFGRTLWREPLDRRDLVTLVLGLLGVGTILLFEINSAAATALSISGVILGLVSGVVVVSMRSLRAENGAWLVGLNHLVAALLLAPLALINAPWPSGTQLLVLAVFGIVQMGIPYLLFARGLRSVPSQEASGIGLLEPVLVPLWIIGHERPEPWTVVGGGLILLGLVLRYVRRTKPSSASPPADVPEM
jgi:drug/metabolite transporter (DMT)-like permease